MTKYTRLIRISPEAHTALRGEYARTGEPLQAAASRLICDGANPRRMRIEVDFGNPADIWWDSGGHELWAALRLLCGAGTDADAITCDLVTGARWVEIAAEIPGWADGPKHAWFPVRCIEVKR